MEVCGELPNVAAYAFQDVHVWSALLTCMRPLGATVTTKAGGFQGEEGYCTGSVEVHDVHNPFQDMLRITSNQLLLLHEIFA